MAIFQAPHNPAPDRAASLTERFGVSVRPEQIVQCHTPLRLGLAAELAEEPVLLVGRGDVKRVGESYGLRRCLTVEELALAAPASVPFAGHIRRRAAQARLAGAAGDAAALETRTNGRPFAAILVLNDPEDWYSALQISLDVVLGRGRPGVRAPRDDAAAPVHVVFCNPDMEWAAAYPTPRLGCGAFAACLEALHRRVAGRPSRGSPEKGDAAAPAAPAHYSPPALASLPLRQRFGAIFAVGDNPHADVAGANAAGAPWVSVLVRTGVFQGAGNSPDHPAAIVVDDVAAAVRSALHRSRAATWHSMR
ncbi:hypothetical protein QBZ16_002797 [Prototheca wickerhamii]|uniref:Uncharacterized protein n=1 Tax=Prototheca wickerhamii TaxID=3111 RepID=A0AAD9INA1_PROWI|nr:hypothetical protein QBZ16_002797 [Prototheca wickerhamii]